MTIEKFIDEIYILKYIIRYNTVPKISQESVAEHSFFVSAIVLHLHKTYDFDLERALVMATVHDFCETHISDVPRNVKNKYPKLAYVLADVEHEVWRDIYPEYAAHIEEMEAKQTAEAKIVNIADALSVLQYAKAEVKLGNDGYMKGVYEYTDRTMVERFKEIEQFKKPQTNK